MSYIGATPTSTAFLTDSFSGDGSTTSFTLSAAPASSSSILVAVSGVLQDPATYAVVGTALNFTGAPPSGTANISVRYLGIPASNISTAAYRTVTEFTATAGQTSFSTPSYTVGFINVYRNGVLLGSADYTATTGTTVVLASGATAGDLITTESFYVSSIYNAISNTAGSVNANNIADGAVGTAELADAGVTAAKLDTTGTANSSTYLRGDMAWSSLPASGKVLQVVQSTSSTLTIFSSTSYTNATDVAATITPSSATSKILIIMSVYAYVDNYNTGSTIVGSKILRSGTEVWAQPLTNGYGNLNSQAVSVVYLDSPATTSSITYQLQVAASSSYNPSRINWSDGSGFSPGKSTVTLMEIAA